MDTQKAQKLSVFTRKALQESITIMRVMEREKITMEDIKAYLGSLSPPNYNDIVFHSGVRKLSRKQREREFKRTRWGRRRP